LSELRDVFMRAGYQVVCMTDHAESFDTEKLKAYTDECDRLSNDRFRFVSGLEFACEHRMHILGYGVTSLSESITPEFVIRHIEDRGGVSVIAHPGDSMFDWIETFKVLPTGIEVWNTKYDGPTAPRPRTFELLNRLQQRKPEMKAFYGQDLHWRNQHRDLFNLIDSESTMREGILGAFRTGNYTGRIAATELPSSGILSASQIADYNAANARYMRKRKFFESLKRWSGSLGKGLPAPIKARIRELFS
jgi:hypothetical protein